MLGKMKKIDIFKMLLTLVALFLIFGIIFYLKNDTFNNNSYVQRGEISREVHS